MTLNIARIRSRRPARDVLAAAWGRCDGQGGIPWPRSCKPRSIHPLKLGITWWKNGVYHTVFGGRSRHPLAVLMF
jgi:hypothetical protein